MNSISFNLPDSRATERLGAALASILAPSSGQIVYLYGELGAGKTTLVRGFLRFLGFTGAVKSPTYTLMESYDLEQGQVHHLDLYRLSDPEELLYTGFEDLPLASSVTLIEWPQQGAGVLPPADLSLTLTYAGRAREAVVTICNQDSLLIQQISAITI